MASGRLSFTDTQNSGTTPPPTQYVDYWSLNFTGRIATTPGNSLPRLLSRPKLTCAIPAFFVGSPRWGESALLWRHVRLWRRFADFDALLNPDSARSARGAECSHNDLARQCPGCLFNEQPSRPGRHHARHWAGVLRGHRQYAGLLQPLPGTGIRRLYDRQRHRHQHRPSCSPRMTRFRRCRRQCRPGSTYVDPVHERARNADIH